MGLAFSDAQIFMSCVKTFKSFVLVGDMYQGTAVFRFTDEMVTVQGKEVLAGTLLKISQDDAPREVLAADFFVHDEHLGFVSFDEEHNMIIYAYVPQDRSTQGGRQLVKQADFSVGCAVMAVIRLQCYEQITPFTPPQLASRQLLIYGSREGTCGLILPVTEDRFDPSSCAECTGSLFDISLCLGIGGCRCSRVVLLTGCSTGRG